MEMGIIEENKILAEIKANAKPEDWVKVPGTKFKKIEKEVNGVYYTVWVS